MKLSALYRKYHNFERLTYTITIDGSIWYPSDQFHISHMELSLSNSLEANIAELRAEDILDRSSVMKLSNGSKIEISIGYEKEETLVFRGYVHRIVFQEKHLQKLAAVELEAMDVKGLMMLYKSSCYKAGSKRSSIVKECMERSFYKGYVKSCTIEALPSALDYESMADSRSDYDLLCEIAQATGYEFFVKQDELIFQKAYEHHAELIFDTWDGVLQVEQETSLDEQFGNLELISLMGLDAMQSVKKQVSCTNKPQNAKMSNILNFTSFTHVEDFQSMEEMKAVCDSFQKKIEYSYGSMRGKCVMLPELVCSDMLVLKNVMDEKEKRIYVNSVTHVIDDDESYSLWQGSMQKG